MIRTAALMTVLLCAFAVNGLAQAQTTSPKGVTVMKMGDASMLTGAKGLTLYVYDPDTDGKSVCNGTCATNWPPLAATADDKPVGSYTIVTRDDGTKQWAYKGKPLYYFKNDKQPMDMTGDGVAGKWHVAKP